MLRILIGLLFCAVVSASGVEVEVSGIANQRGDVCLLVFSGEVGFPNDPEKAVAKFAVSATKAKGGVVKFKIPGLKKGNYAFVALHDEDKDRKVKKNVFGIPKEGVAISNYPKLRPPKFEKAAVKNPGGILRLRLSY